MMAVRDGAAHLTSMTDNRVPAGVPTGGQFAPTTHAEADMSLHDPAAPVPLSQALDEAGGESLVIDESELGTDLFACVEVTRPRPGGPFWATGVIDVDFVNDMAEEPDPPDDYTRARERRLEWLDDHQRFVEVYLADTYGARLDDGCEEWEDQRIEFTADLGPDARTDQVVQALENHTRATQAHADLNGADGSRLHGFHGSLRDAAHEHRVALGAASEAFWDAALTETNRTSMWSRIDAVHGQPSLADQGYTVADIAPGTRARERERIESFLLDNRRLIQAVQDESPVGRRVTDADIGHTLLRTGNDPDSAAGADLGDSDEAQALLGQVRRFGRTELHVGVDGRLAAVTVYPAD